MSLKAQRGQVSQCQGIIRTRPLWPKCGENPIVPGTQMGPEGPGGPSGRFRPFPPVPAQGPTPQALILSFLPALIPAELYYFSMLFSGIPERV